MNVCIPNLVQSRGGKHTLMDLSPKMRHLAEKLTKDGTVILTAYSYMDLSISVC